MTGSYKRGRQAGRYRKREIQINSIILIRDVELLDSGWSGRKVVLDHDEHKTASGNVIGRPQLKESSWFLPCEGFGAARIEIHPLLISGPLILGIGKEHELAGFHQEEMMVRRTGMGIGQGQ